VLVQIPGRALRVNVGVLRHLVAQSEPFRCGPSASSRTVAGESQSWIAARSSVSRVPATGRSRPGSRSCCPIPSRASLLLTI